MFDLALAWAAARRFAEAIVALYGAAGEIAQRISLNANARRDLKARLESLEALVRKLLFLEASELPAPSIKAPRATSERKSLHIASEADINHDARDWRVGFRCLPRGKCVVAAAQTTHRASQRGFALNGLARRLEALSRVLANPVAAAKRLRKRMTDLQASAARLLMDNPREDRSDGEHLAACGAIWSALANANSS